jgi:hypothetical protein
MIRYRINSRRRDHPLGWYPDGEAVPRVRRVTDGAWKTADRVAILRRAAIVILALVGLVFLAVGIGLLVSRTWAPATGKIGACTARLDRLGRRRPRPGSDRGRRRALTARAPTTAGYRVVKRKNAGNG